ncbi:Fatty acyl-CoA synthetase and RNA processing-associated kinase 1 [Smittium mucronatum]|uniref:Fatty acyl-CoA synthetase and RNA processing-associated kinase 1 n=1 Tax=Smittium mucronatum TaxID=133383 RepID=A0A1R0GMR2_9FUNG|nr:Fatty acyl-CoA synthetase and RNA processing-associated kinase 1 [Smittium mucronatum]
MVIKKTASLQENYISDMSSPKIKRPSPISKNKFFGDYLLLQTIGEGEFAKVKLGLHRNTGQEVAIKLVKKEWIDSKIKKAKIIREISSLKKINHENIVRLYDIIESENHIGLVLEYASGGELFDYIMKNQCLKDSEAKRIFSQLVLAVSFLHKNEIVHRDLKLENILLDSKKNVKVTDFGFANHFDEVHGELMITSCGSPCYAAPELVVSNGMYAGTNVDVWSCGVILFAMLAGYLPFDDDESNPNGENINLLYKYILSTDLYYPSQISKSARSLISRLLVTDPVNRATMAEVRQHPWLEPYRHLYDQFDGPASPTTVVEGGSSLSQKTKKIKLFFSQGSKKKDDEDTENRELENSKYTFKKEMDNFPNSVPNSQPEKSPHISKSNATANGAIEIFSKISGALNFKNKKKEQATYKKSDEADGSVFSEDNQLIPLMEDHFKQQADLVTKTDSKTNINRLSTEPRIISWISKKLLFGEPSNSSEYKRLKKVNIPEDSRLLSRMTPSQLITHVIKTVTRMGLLVPTTSKSGLHGMKILVVRPGAKSTNSKITRKSSSNAILGCFYTKKKSVGTSELIKSQSTARDSAYPDKSGIMSEGEESEKGSGGDLSSTLLGKNKVKFTIRVCRVYKRSSIFALEFHKTRGYNSSYNNLVNSIAESLELRC